MATLGFKITPRTQILMKDIGIHPVNVLRRAELPEDLFNRNAALLSTEEWFKFWRGIEDEAMNPLLPLAIGQALTFEAFDPPVFAALCSPNLNVALCRISLYKKLCAPLELRLDRQTESTKIEFRWPDSRTKPPILMILTELVYFVQLARKATRKRICPIEIFSPVLPEQNDEYAEYFGVRIRHGNHPTLRFSAKDAQCPFLTANPDLWNFFEPELQRQLAKLDNSSTESERIHAALLELLPGGTSSIESVCKKLGMSKRTLQRRLSENNETFQSVLNETRSRLALHYLKDPALSCTEISFLLGFEDPNSFFRAFRSWTGKTPQEVRGTSQN